MTNTIIYFSLLLIYVTLKHVAVKPLSDDIFYTETVNFQHQNGTWICGDIECPEHTFGCKIRIKSDGGDKKILSKSFSCLDTYKRGTLGAIDRINLPKAKVIDIELETYEGAVSIYSTGYGMGGHENAKGVVAVYHLNELKESARKNKKIIVDSNA